MRPESVELLHEFRQRCAAAGWNFTSQRFSLYCYLQDNYEHPSVETVLAFMRTRHPAISRDSVHRMLNDFFAHGFIERLDNLAIIRYDANPVRHDHFMCRVCGRVIDVNVESARHEIAAVERTLGLPEDWEIRISGVCPECRKVKNSA